MAMLKLDYTIVKEPFHENNFVEIELQNCMHELESREGRVDARIREKKQQLAKEQQ
jgi:hypothetical protein